MAVTAVSGLGGANEATNQTAHTRSITVPAGTDLLLVACAVYDGGSAAFSSVTFNSDTVTLVTASTSSASLMRVAHFYRLAPDIATGPLVVNYDVSADVVWSGAHAWAGVDATTPWSDVVTAGASSLTVTNVGADDVAVATCADTYVSSSGFVGAGWTQTRTLIWEDRAAGGQVCLSQYEATLTGSVSLGMSAGTPVVHTGLRLRAGTGAPSCALSGTVVSESIDEGDIQAGGETIILTLTNDTWVADDGTFAGIRDDIIAGLDSSDSDPNGWNDLMRDGGSIAVTDVVRNSSTQVTITLQAEPSFGTGQLEVITVTIPAVAVTSNTAMETTPLEFSISVGGSTAGPAGIVNGGLVNQGLVNSGVLS